MLLKIKKKKTSGFKLIKLLKSCDEESLKRRIDYAEYLLVQTAEPVEKIASDCGWTNVQTFTAIFQKAVGVTSPHYRNRQQK